MSQETLVNNDLFYPVEHAILCDWLDTARPEGCADINLYAQVDETDNGPVTLKPSSYGDLNEFVLANAVARLVLGGIQKRLPTSAVCYPDKVVLTRDFAPKTRRKLDLLPQFLFQINWASSGPGISWPVAYYLTWLPVYDINVVTESADSPDAYGYCDRALGWFESSTLAEQGIKEVITLDWQTQYSEGEQQHWESFWTAGLISKEDALKWADEVWSDGDEDDERDAQGVTL